MFHSNLFSSSTNYYQLNRERGETNIDTFRKEYKPLTDEQKSKVEAVKVKAEELMALLDASTPLPGVNGVAGRCMATAKTNLETAIMWAVKGMTA